MNGDPNICIYFRSDNTCTSRRLSGVRPHCPYYAAGVCLCGGKVGRIGILPDQRKGFSLQEPAPSLLRWRA